MISTRWFWFACVLLLPTTVTSQEDPLPNAGGEAKAPSVLTRFVIGVQCRPLADTERQTVAVKQGLLVENVVDDSPAARAGLRRGDILLSAGGKALDSVARLVEVVQSSKELDFELIPAGGKAADRRRVRVRPVRALELKAVEEDGSALLDLLRQGVEGPDSEEVIPRIERWMELPNAGPLRAFGIRPALLLPSTRPLPDLPRGTSVAIRQTGSDPTQVTVQWGKQQWEGTARDWPEWTAEIPEPQRAAVRRYLQALLAPPAQLYVELLQTQQQLQETAAVERRLAKLENEIEQLQALLEQALAKRRGSAETRRQD